MPLVFVHGVSNREGKTDEEKAIFHNRLKWIGEQFSAMTFTGRAPSGIQTFQPYWGNAGATFARDLACIPHSEVQALALGTPELAPLIEAVSARLDHEVLKQDDLAVAPLLTIARSRSLADAVDILFAGVSTAPVLSLAIGEESVTDATRRTTASLADATTQYALANPHPAWLGEVSTDDEFLDRLLAEVNNSQAPSAEAGAVAAVQALGWGDEVKQWLQNAAQQVGNVVGQIKSKASHLLVQGVRDGYLEFSSSVRPAASVGIGRFFGDVFVYLQTRAEMEKQTPITDYSPILKIVLKAVDDADKARTETDKELYLVGHSFGGIILYDILTRYRPELKCDLLLTVGSQVALFAEMGRLADAATIEAAFAKGPTALVPRPATVKHWLNVYDTTDLVGFGTKDIFDEVTDFSFDTETLPLLSHGAYFDSPRFYQRVKERVNEAFAKDAAGQQEIAHQ